MSFGLPPFNRGVPGHSWSARRGRGHVAASKGNQLPPRSKHVVRAGDKWWDKIPAVPEWAKETGKVLAPPVLNITGYVGVAFWLDSKSERHAELLYKATNAQIKSVKDSSDAQIAALKESSAALKEATAAVKTSADAQVAALRDSITPLQQFVGAYIEKNMGTAGRAK